MGYAGPRPESKSPSGAGSLQDALAVGESCNFPSWKIQSRDGTKSSYPRCFAPSGTHPPRLFANATILLGVWLISAGVDSSAS